MALNSRQQKLYVHTCDLYKPKEIAQTRLGYDVESLSYPEEPTYSDVQFYRETAPEFTKGEFYGRRNREDTVSLMDKAHFDVAQEVNANWRFKFTTEGHPDEGKWYLISGDDMV
jgi:hypothetical protein